MGYGIITAIFLLVSAVVLTVQVFLYSPISPDILELPPAVYSPPLYTPNNYLQAAIKLGEGILKEPEDVSVDEKGILYTGTGDGWIKRLLTNGTWENWKKINDGHNLLGLTVTRAGDVIVCDSEEVIFLNFLCKSELDSNKTPCMVQGLIKVSEDGEVTALATQMNGTKLRSANNVVEAPDGSLYFSISSTKYGMHDWGDLLEGKPHGQLLKYDPSTKETSLVLDELWFANGVTISSDQEFLVVCESWKFRCLKYWLKEEMRGKVDIFIDNLPGFPDNIKPAPDGSFWIAILQLTSSRLKCVHSAKVIVRLLELFPKLVGQIANDRFATALNVGSDGKIIKRLDDPTGKVVAAVTSVLEFDGNLYLGSLTNDYIGKLLLRTAV